MQTHRPFRPRPAPRRSAFAAQLVVLSAVAILANFGWTSTYEPDPFDPQRLRHRDRDDTPGGQEPRDQHGAGDTTGPIGAYRPAERPPAAGGAVSDEAAAGGDATLGRRPGGEENGGDGSGASVAAGPAVDVGDEQTATAQWFVTAALDGRLGDAHQQAAQTAVTVATEHGFVDDPTRVAEALVVFLHPDHR